MSDNEVVRFAKDQRMPEPGEPVCVICGRYGEYICDENDSDICSLECKEILLKQLKQKSQNVIQATCDDTAFYNWRVSAYYKYFTWGSLYTNKDIVEIRRGLHITVHGDFYHSLLSYDNIALPQQMRSNLTDMGVSTPTPIQMESIPCILSNRDVLLRSNTGSGKTLAYLIPLILLQLDYYENYHTFTDLITLILVPNRELAIQIDEVVKELTKNLIGIRTALIIGGESREQQRYRLHNNSNFLIATPGRLIDLISFDKEWMVSLMKNVRSVVLDEADLLMKSDFQDQVLSLLPSCTSQCFQRIVVSATVTLNLKNQLLSLLSQPLEVLVDDVESLNSSLHYDFYWCEENQKKKKLASLFRETDKVDLPGVIICQTRLEVSDVMNFLSSSFPTLSHIAVTVETPFQERREIMKQFQEGETSLLVATAGIIGRGIELVNAHTIVLWSFPSSISEFIHCAGRIGREGSEGHVISFCNAHNKKVFPGLVKLCEKSQIKLPKQIKQQLEEDDCRNTKFSTHDLKRMNLFKESSFQEWKRFKSK